MSRRHRNDTATYRELPNYGDRVKSFNMAVNKLVEYARVQGITRPKCAVSNITGHMGMAMLIIKYIDSIDKPKLSHL